MISKELLSEVLDEKVNEEETDMEGKILLRHLNNKIWWHNDEQVKSINIYELAHKCKEWVRDKEYMMTIYLHLDCIAVKLSERDIAFVADSEPEAIFKACEWIREQKDV